jgi:hypothetical protein
MVLPRRTTKPRLSVAMTAETERDLRAHLLRPDGQEDLCMVVYRPSTGLVRMTTVLATVILPVEGETDVHGNVSFTGDFVLRATEEASKAGGGVAIVHSHPGGRGWQGMSSYDADAEASYANLVREITGLPLLGMTLAGADGSWSARLWNRGLGVDVRSSDCENVRVVGDRLNVTWNDRLVPRPTIREAQARTVSCWGPRVQADLARLRILVVGAGTLGLDVALRLAATGVQTIGILDFDTLKVINLDRMIGPTCLDALLKRSKVDVAIRLLRAQATAVLFTAVPIDGSICEPHILEQAIDYDLIFCCVDDHPWPRSVLNAIAYADLIPVIDGGIYVDAFPDGDGMRNATWRSHVLRPGRPCMACNGQLDLGKVHADREGLLDDETYIAGLSPSDRPQSQNVAALAVSATGSLLAQFVSLIAAPANIGEPGPLRYSLSTHWLERVEATTRRHCPVEAQALAGDDRQIVLGEHDRAHEELRMRRSSASAWRIRVGLLVERALCTGLVKLQRFLEGA